MKTSMKTTGAALSLLLMLAPGDLCGQAPLEPTGTVRGTVVRSDTSAPVTGVTITLTPQATAAQTAAFRNASARRGPTPKEFLFLSNNGDAVLVGEQRRFPGSPLSDPIVTDAGGRFTIENVPVGSYAVSAEREGYFGRGSSPETPFMFDSAATVDMVYITVSSEKPAEAALTLVPAGAISGRVFDSDGKVLPDLVVYAMRAHRDGNITSLHGVTNASTDDRGFYRLHTLPPGEYFIAAGLRSPEDSEANADPAAAEDSGLQILPAAKRESALFAFHPSTTDPSTVPPIVIVGGEDFGDRDVRILRAPVIKIVGEVVNDSDVRDISSVYVSLVPSGWSVDLGGILGGVHMLASVAATRIDTNRWKFEIRGAFPQGSQELQVTASTGTRSPDGWKEIQASVSLSVGSQNIDGVVVILKAESEKSR